MHRHHLISGGRNRIIKRKEWKLKIHTHSKITKSSSSNILNEINELWQKRGCARDSTVSDEKQMADTPGKNKELQNDVKNKMKVCRKYGWVKLQA
jgi:hypothetical protein